MVPIRPEPHEVPGLVSLLPRQPLLPIFCELIDIFPRDAHQLAHILHLRRVLLEVNFVDEMLDRTISPLKHLLSEENLDVTAAEVLEFGGKSVDGNAFYGAWSPFESIISEQRPSAYHGPTGDIGIGLHDLLDARGGILGGLFVVVSLADFDAGKFRGGVLHTLNPFLQVGCVLVARQNGDDSLPSHRFSQFFHHLLAALYVVDGVGDEAFAGGRIGIERGDRNPIFHGGIDGVGEFVGVRTTDGDAAGAAQNELFNRFGLLLRVLFIRGAPIDFNVDIVFLAQLFRGLFRADTRRLEYRVALRFGD